LGYYNGKRRENSFGETIFGLNPPDKHPPVPYEPHPDALSGNQVEIVISNKLSEILRRGYIVA
jgi:hypothetical protein